MVWWYFFLFGLFWFWFTETRGISLRECTTSVLCTFSILGLLADMVSLMTAWIYKGLKFSGTFDTLYYVAPCMALSLFPFAVGLEGRKLIDSGMLYSCDNGTSSMLLPANMTFANFSERIDAANAATDAANAAANNAGAEATNCGMGHEQAMNLFYIFIGAFLAFMLTFSEFLLVGYAGSLTLSVAGIVRFAFWFLISIFLVGFLFPF